MTSTSDTDRYDKYIVPKRKAPYYDSTGYYEDGEEDEGDVEEDEETEIFLHVKESR